MSHPFILTLSCKERPGIVNAVTAFLFGNDCDIVEHQQFDDASRGQLFLRTAFVCGTDTDTQRLTDAFRAVADQFSMTYRITGDHPERLLVMVSKMGHCLNDLIFRWRGGNLGGELVAIVSNHPDLRPMAEAAGLPFHHVPVTSESKPQAEARLLELVEQYQADLVSSWSARPRTTSPAIWTRGRSSSRKSFGSTTITTPGHCPPWGRMPKRWPCPGRCAGTASSGC